MYEIPKLKHAYVIYNPRTSLYATGGFASCNSKKPKIWSNIGHLKNHFRNFDNNGLGMHYGAYEGTEEIHDIIEKKCLGNVKEFVDKLGKVR